MVHRPSTLSKRKVFRKTKKKKISNILQYRGGAKTEEFSNEKKQTKSDNTEQVKGTVEPKKVSAVTNGRLTLPNVTAGIFMRGKTSSFCTRTEVHLNPLNEARMNEKLHDILKLARNDNHSKCKYKSANIEKNPQFDMSRLLPAVRLEKEVSPSFLKSPAETSITTPKDRNYSGITMGFTNIEINNCDGEMKNANHRNDIQAITEISSHEDSYVHTYLQFREFLEYLDEVSYLKRTCTTDYVADLKNLLKQKSRVSTQQKLSLYTNTTVQSGKYIQEVPERKNKTVIEVHTQEDNSLRKKHRPNIANNFQKNKNFKSVRKKSEKQIKILGRDCGEISNTGTNVDINACEAKGSVHDITAKFSFPSPVIFLQQSQETSENNLNERVPLNAISFLEQTLSKSNETENDHQQKFTTALFGHESKHSPWYRSENAWLEDESTSPFHLGADENAHEMLSVQKDSRTHTTRCSSSKSSLHSDATGHGSFQYSLACTRNSPYSEDTHLSRYDIPENTSSPTTATNNQEFSPFDILETRLLNYRKYHIPNKMEISGSTGSQIKKPNCIELARCKNTFTMERFQILDNVNSTSVNTPHTFDSKQDLMWCRRRMF